jgi:arylsulfatase A-like enzyme
MIQGESRPASPCATLRFVTAHKGRRIPASGTLTVRIPAGLVVPTPALLDLEAFTYEHVPRDRTTRLGLRTVASILSSMTTSRSLERVFAHETTLQRAPQARGVLVSRLPETVTLHFDPALRGQRALLAVWAWAVPATRVVVDVTPAPADRLALSFGVRDRGAEEGSPRVTFTVSLGGARGEPETVLLRRTLDPARVEGDRGWQEVEVDVPRSPDAPRPLVLAATVEDQGGAASFGTFARPALLASGDDAPPNILLLSFDTLRSDRVGAYGYGRGTTPTLDRLAAAGMLFEQVVSAFPSTTGSHMTMLTSLEPCAHGITLPTVRLADTIPTVTERLAAAGYATVAVTEDGLINGVAGFDRGFDSYRDLTTDGTQPLGIFDRGIARTRAWLERHGTRPFFMFFHTYQVHTPYKVPPHLRDLFPVAATASEAERLGAQYDEGLRYADELFAGFLDFLAERGLLARTLLVITSDHGTEFGEHGGIGHARSVYEEQLHVPLILHHPTLAAGGRRVPEPVGLVDLAPTFLDVAGTKAPDIFVGRSLVPYLRDPGHHAPPRPLFGEQLWGSRETMLRDGSRAWIARPSGLELYDLERDPGQHRNLAASEPSLAAEGAQRIEDFRTECARRAGQLRRAPATPTVLDPNRTNALKALGYIR